MNRESNLQRTSSSSHIGTAEMSLAMWLRNGRAQKNLSLEDVARITKIQVRTLERLEAGRLDGLPAEVFVKGFVRSFARCVGLDENEALRRYTACLKDGASKVPPAVAARAVIDAMGELAPNARARAPQTPQILRDEPGFAAGSMEIPTVDSVEVTSEAIEAAPVEAEASESVEISLPQVIEVAPLEAVVVAPPADVDLSAEIVVPAEASAPTKKKRTRKATVTSEGTSKRRRKVATGTPVEPTPVVAAADVSEGISAALDAEVDVQAEPVAPKRRRKPRGSVQPIVESVEPIEVSEASAPSELETISAEAAVVATPVEPTEPVVEWRSVFDLSPINGEINGHVETELPVETASSIEVAEDTDSSTSRFERIEEDAPVQLAWTPRMPPFAVTAPPSWRKSPAAPALVAVIDDADPDGAERVLEDRRAGERRRTFLPPILLDRDGDRSGRQGGLTLAVIILLIAATLTLSYLMRRPSASGDGVTLDETSASARSIG